MDEVYGSARLLFKNTNDGQQSELGDVMGNFFGGTYLDNEATEIEENLFIFSEWRWWWWWSDHQISPAGNEKREKGIQIP